MKIMNIISIVLNGINYHLLKHIIRKPWNVDQCLQEINSDRVSSFSEFIISFFSYIRFDKKGKLLSYINKNV